MSQAVDVLIVESPSLDTDGQDAAWRASLEHEPTLHTVGEAELFASGADRAVALVALPALSPKSGIAQVARLKGRHPGLRVLVAFHALDADDLGRLLALGVDGLIARSAPSRDVCAAIMAMAEAGAPASAAPERVVEIGDGLTPREAEILRFLSSGFSNKEVARRLSLSVRTVETHRLNLRRKTQTGRLKDLVSLARQLGLPPVMDAEPARRAPAIALSRRWATAITPGSA